MPQTYSEFQLQRNKVAGQAFERIATRSLMIGMDIFKLILDFIKSMVNSVLGK